MKKWSRLLVLTTGLALIGGILFQVADLRASDANVSLSVTIQGETHPAPGSYCTYSAHVTGGSGNYSYEWYWGNSLVSTASYVSIIIPAPPQPGDVRPGFLVLVSDGNDTGSGGITIYPTPGGDDCNS